MSERIPTNITSMTDVTLVRDWDGADTMVTVYNNRQSDWDIVDNLRYEGFVVTRHAIV